MELKTNTRVEFADLVPKGNRAPVAREDMSVPTAVGAVGLEAVLPHQSQASGTADYSRPRSVEGRAIVGTNYAEMSGVTLQGNGVEAEVESAVMGPVVSTSQVRAEMRLDRPLPPPAQPQHW